MKKKLILIGIVTFVLVCSIFITNMNKVTVTLNIDGTVHELGNLKKGGTIYEPTSPEKEGYTFQGWYVGEEKYDFTKPVTGDLELVAKWEINVYEVIIKNGNKEEKLSVNHGGTIAEPKKPTKKGYVFQGWYVGKEKYDFDKPVTDNLELVAKWLESKYSNYTVEHYLVDKLGNVSQIPFEVEKLVGRNDIKIKPSVKEYVGYVSPSVQSVKISKNGTTVIKYYYETRKYTLTLQALVGTEISIQSGEYFHGDEVTIEALALAGYTFKEWQKNGEVYSNNLKISIVVTEDLTLSALADVNKYMISFNSNGGSDISSITQDFNTVVEKPTAPVKFGYDFIGWYIDEELTNPYVFTTMPSEDITLYAKWELSVYNITYILDGGVVSNVATYTIDDEIILNNPEKVGYAFEYWLLGENKVTKIEKGTSGDLELVAVYKANTNTKYTVEHYQMGLDGKYSSVFETEVLEGVSDTKVTPFTKTYEGFKSPEASELLIKADGTAVIKYYYERNKYNITVTYDKGISSVVGNGLYYYGEEINIFATVKPGYEFSKWSTGDTSISFKHRVESELEIKATTSLIKYTITYNLNGGIGSNVTIYTVEDEVILNAPIKFGYTLDYWLLGGNKITKIEKGTTGNLELTAVYKANTDTKYTVEHYQMGLDGNYSSVFETEVLKGTTDTKVKPAVKTYKGFKSPEASELLIKADGTAVIKYYYERNKYTITLIYDSGVSHIEGNGLYYYGKEINVSAILNKGYSFKEWLNNDKNYSNERSFTLTVTDNISLKAVTIQNLYTITFDSNGGSKVNNATAHYNETISKPTDPTRKDYTFAGWYEDKEFTKAYDFTQKIDDYDFTLYAKWLINDCTIIFDSNGGSEVPSIHQEYDTVVEKPADPTKLGYDFVGWYMDKELTRPYVFNTMPREGIILYAKWRLSIYNISYELNGGTANNVTTYTVEDEIIFNIPKKLGYTFEYWLSGNKKLTKIEKGTTGNLDLVAVYKANTDTKYKVEHYQMGLDGKYSIFETEVLEGTTDSKIEPSVKTYEGFKSPEPSELLIKADGTAVIKYYYERNKYTVTITHDKGISSVTGSGTYYYGEEVNISATVKTGYTFNKWSNGSTNINSKHKVVGTEEVKATTNLINYTITYKLNNGATTNPIIYTIEDEIILSNPTKIGYTFEYWLLNNNKITKIEKGTTGNLEITAVYKASTDTKYKVEHYQMGLDGKYSIFETEVLEGTTDTKVKPTVKTYKGFKSPEASELLIKADGTAVIKYYYERNKYTITVTHDKGISSVVGSGTYYYGEEVNISATLKVGYKFNKWSNGSTNINSKHKVVGTEEVKATTNLINYTITYKLNGGTANNVTTYTIEDEVILNNPIKVGYSFDYWLLNNNKITKIEKGTTGNLEITAVYKSNNNTKYKVEHYQMGLDGKYGSAFETESFEGESDTKVKPAVKNYEGFKSPKVAELLIKADGTSVLKYYYERNKYTITVTHDKGISSVVGSGTYYYGEEVNISATVETGYTFNKWSNGDTTVNSKHKVVGTEEVKATTNLIKYTITYKLNGGVTNNVTTYTIEDEVILTNSTKTGYTFTNWLLGNNIITKIEKGTTGNLEITAVYKANQYEVKYNGNGSTEGAMTNSKHEYDVSSNLNKNSYQKDNVLTLVYYEGKQEKKTLSTTFKGWALSKTANVTYTDMQSIKNLTDINGKVVELFAKWDSTTVTLTNPERDGYVFAGWSTTSDGKNIVSATYKFDGNATLYAVWKLVPLIEEVSFKVYKDSDGNNPYSLSDLYAKGDKAFYIKFPKKGYIDAYSIKVKLNTPITLNTKATASSTYADITPVAADKVQLLGQTLKVTTNDGGITWNGPSALDSSNSMIVSVRLLSLLLDSSSLEDKQIGIALGFGLSKDGIKTPHYVSKRMKINGDTYFFFSREGTKDIKVTYKYGDKTKTVYIPYGTPTPAIGAMEIDGRTFKGWYTDSSYTKAYDFSKPLYNNVTLYAKYN